MRQNRKGCVAPFAEMEADLRRKHDLRSSNVSGVRLGSFQRFVIGSVLLDNASQAVALYRLSHYFASREWHVLAAVSHAFSKFITHVDISPYAQIGSGFVMFHGLGSVIGKGTVVGSDVTAYHGITLGGGPTIGGGTMIWSGASVLGRVSIGDGAVIGASAVVLSDVPPGATVVGNPARVVPKNTDNGG